MSLVYRDITFLNFDETYVPQTRLLETPHEWIDFQDIHHVKGYCETGSLSEIQHRLLHRLNHGITFIGSGDYHYVSYLLLTEVQEDFTLLLFDHHTDMFKPFVPSLISCGSWVSDALASLPLLKKVILIGVRPDFITADRWLSKVVLYPESSRLHHPDFVEQVLSSIETETVYVSIDKDVLDPAQVITNWDQGSLQLSVLLDLLHHVLSEKKVFGIDICGEYPVSPMDLLSPGNMAAIYRNEQTNQKILQTIQRSA